jgi:hypothetical protein
LPVNQTSPGAVGNFSLTHIFSPKTFIDIKASYFWGYYYLEPVYSRDAAGHEDLPSAQYLTNSTNYYDADRNRFQANASLTHYAEDFIHGSHDFKFADEVERSWARTRYGYNGKTYTYYLDAMAYAGGSYQRLSGRPPGPAFRLPVQRLRY